jgi:hypothetical protein
MSKSAANVFASSSACPAEPFVSMKVAGTSRGPLFFPCNSKCPEDAAATSIQKASVVFGCLDKESPRLFLTDLCSAFKITYFDLATDTGGEDEDWYGGRVVYCDGTRCLSCLGLLDQRLIRIEQLTEAELENERRLYGLKGDLLGGTGPAVVSVNGVVASMAVTEFMAHVTGIRPPAPQLDTALTCRG